MHRWYLKYYIALENIENYKRSKRNLIEAREPVCNRRYPPPKVKLMKKEEPQTESNLQTNKEWGNRISTDWKVMPLVWVDEQTKQRRIVLLKQWNLEFCQKMIVNKKSPTLAGNRWWKLLVLLASENMEQHYLCWHASDICKELHNSLFSPEV